MTVAPPLAALLFEGPPIGWPGGLVIAASVTVAVLAYTTGFRWQQTVPGARFGLLGLRVGAVACLFLTLLHPTWVSERSLEEKPVLAVVLDDSASMGQIAAEAETQGLTDRGAEARAPASGDAGPRPSRYALALTTLRDGLLPAAARTFEVRLYDVQGRALHPERLPAEATAPCSPLTDTLLRVQADLRDRPPVGIALLSDGRETAAEPALGSIDQLRIPVYALELAAASASAPRTPDVAIRAVSASRRALVGNTVSVAVDLEATGVGAATRIPIAIADGADVVASRTVVLQEPSGSEAAPGTPGVRTQRVDLEFVPRRPGSFEYAASVGALPGERDLSDNRQTFLLDVRAEPLTVLYIDGVLRWEGKFLREALAGDPDVHIIAAVRTARPGADHGSPGLLLGQQLAAVAVVILGDVEAAYFSPGELEALRNWVTQGGGGLVLTGGYHSFGPDGFGRTALRDILPVEFSAAPDPQVEQPLSLRLTEPGRAHPIFNLTGDPVRDTAFFQRLPALEGCTRVAGVKAGAEVLALATDRTGNTALPLLIAQQVGAGRTLVLTADTTWRWRMVVGGFSGDSSFYDRFWGQLVRWMAREEEDAQTQLVVSTSRPRYRLGETIELNIELAAAGRAPQDGPQHRRRAAQAAPDAAPATAEAREGTGRPKQNPAPAEQGPAAAHAGWCVTAQVLDESSRPLAVPLVELGAGRYRGTLGALRPGRLDVHVAAEHAAPDIGASGDTGTLPAGAGADPAALSRVVSVEVAAPDVELLNVQPDPQWLARVTQATGGRLVQRDSLPSWVAQLPAEPLRRTVRLSSGALGDWIFGGAFLALLCAEWVVRRRSQLP